MVKTEHLIIMRQNLLYPGQGIVFPDGGGEERVRKGLGGEERVRKG